MKKNLFALSVLTGVSVALQAQSTSTTSQQSGATAGQQSEVLPKPGQTAAPPQASSDVQGQQSWPGVLLDASCPAIASNLRSGTSPTSTGVTVYTGSSSQAPSTTTAGAAGTRTAGGGDAPLSRNTTGADVAPARSTSEEAAQATRDERQTSTTPAPGTAGAKAAETAGTSTAGPPATTGERSRTVQTDTTTSSWFATVKDKYRDCMARSTSTAFAIHTEDGLMVLDEAGNLAVRQAMLSDDFRTGLSDGSGSPRWMSVTLNGSIRGDKLTVTTVGK